MSTPANPILIRNGRVITATDDYVADVLLKDGIVHTIGHQIQVGPDVAVITRPLRIRMGLAGVLMGVSG